MSKQISRLLGCGFTERNASEIYWNYANRGDWNGLENFIRECELLYNDYKEYPKEDF